MQGKWPRRRSIRLQGYDYAQNGAYFVTICSYGRECIFGEVEDGTVRLSEVGQIVEEEWWRTPDLRLDVDLDAFVIMPNHLHGLLVFQAADAREEAVAGGGENTGRMPGEGEESGRMGSGRMQCAPTNRGPGTLGAVIAGFESATTRRVNDALRIAGAPLWQRNYYEHIVRNDADLDRIRAYIEANPSRWFTDPDNPAHRS